MTTSASTSFSGASAADRYENDFLASATGGIIPTNAAAHQELISVNPNCLNFKCKLSLLFCFF